jgi:hypothetical protein
MSSIDPNNIDDTKPTSGNATTSSVRDNFTAVKNQLSTAKNEMDAVEAHVSADGSSHTFIDQDVTTSGTPTFAKATIGSMQLSLAAGVSVAQGEMAWNADEETIDFGMNGAIWQGGLETFYHIRNDSGATLTNGTLVMATGTIGASGRILVDKFDGSDPANVKRILGFVTYDIVDGADGKVTNFGKVRGLDTSAWNDGDILWASDTVPGEITSTEPGGGSLGMPVAFVVYSHASVGTLFARITPINENKYALHNNLQSLNSGDYKCHWHPERAAPRFSTRDLPWDCIGGP